MSIIFLFLSIDEAIQIHENIGDIVENYIKATGFLYFPWVLPYAFAVIVLSVFYVKFMFKILPKKTMVLFILSGTIYLTGVIGFDMLGGREAELHGYESLTYSILYTIEEFLEMLGVVILIYTLLLYMETHFGYMYVIMKFNKTADVQQKL